MVKVRKTLGESTADICQLAKVQWTLTNWPTSSDVLAEMQWTFANCHGRVLSVSQVDDREC
jgi:hypothetical protein